MSWITLRTASRWEAEWIAQLLTDHDIPCQIIDLGISSYLGGGSPTALQVLPESLSIASQLLTPLEQSIDETDESLGLT